MESTIEGPARLSAIARDAPGPPRRPESTDDFYSFVEENRLPDSAGNARTVPVTSVVEFNRYLLLDG